MPQFVLRDIPDDVWARFKSRLDRDRWPAKKLLVQLMDDYGRDAVHPSTAPPAQLPEYAWLRAIYARIRKEVPVFQTLGHTGRWLLLHQYVRRNQPESLPAIEAIESEDQQRDVLDWLETTTNVRGNSRDGQLSLRAIAHTGMGPDLQTDRRPIMFEVLGLAPGRQAWISEFAPEQWHVLRVDDGQQQRQWSVEHYPTPQIALRAVELGWPRKE